MGGCGGAWKVGVWYNGVGGGRARNGGEGGDEWQRGREGEE